MGSGWDPGPPPLLGPRYTLHQSPLPQTETSQPSVAKLSEMLPKISETALSPPSKETLSQISMVSGAPIHSSATPSVHSLTPSSISWTPSLVVLPGEPGSAALDSQAQELLSQIHIWHTRRTLSETLVPFYSLPDVHLRSSAPDALPDHPLPLEQTDWSQSKMLDLEPIDALNFFCEQQRAWQPSSLQEEPEGLCLHPRTPVPNAVVPQPRRHL